MPASLRRSLILAFALILALPMVAAAESYTITLRNGSTFHSRYQPQAAPWDAAKILVRNEFGNMISLDQAEVTSVANDAENRGFGKAINNTTLMLGDAPNDAPQPGDDTGGGDQGDQTADTPYSINQFVEPGQTQGMPGSWLGNGSGGGSSSAPSAPAPKPAPKPAAPVAAPPSGGSGIG